MTATFISERLRTNNVPVVVYKVRKIKYDNVLLEIPGRRPVWVSKRLLNIREE